jgi:hypothetical protein
MKYRYTGTELTHHTVLGPLTPGMVGEGPDELVAACIAGGLLEAVDPDEPAAPAEEEA